MSQIITNSWSSFASPVFTGQPLTRDEKITINFIEPFKPLPFFDKPLSNDNPYFEYFTSTSSTSLASWDVNQPYTGVSSPLTEYTEQYLPYDEINTRDFSEPFKPLEFFDKPISYGNPSYAYIPLSSFPVTSELSTPFLGSSSTTFKWDGSELKVRVGDDPFSVDAEQPLPSETLFTVDFTEPFKPLPFFDKPLSNDNPYFEYFTSTSSTSLASWDVNQPYTGVRSPLAVYTEQTQTYSVM